MPNCDHFNRLKNIGKALLVLTASIWVLLPGLLLAASPGLPFSEDFSDTNLMDASKTNATWSTAEQEAYLAWRSQLYGTMTDPISYQIGDDEHTRKGKRNPNRHPEGEA